MGIRGKYEDTLCSPCKIDEETTEHVIQCDEYRRIVGHSIKCDGPIGEYMQDLDWRLEAGDVYEKIEEIPQIKRKIS